MMVGISGGLHGRIEASFIVLNTSGRSYPIWGVPDTVLSIFIGQYLLDR